MKILHVIPYLGCGGAEILLSKIALHQKQKGHEVEIVTLQSPDETYEHFPDRQKFESEIPVTRISSRMKLLKPSQKKDSLAGWKNILDRFQPDVIHAHLYEADVLSHSILIPDTVYVTHIHGPLLPLEKKKYIPSSKKEIYEVIEKKWLYQQYKKSDSRFIAISGSMAEYGATLIPHALRHNIRVIHNGIEIERYQFRERKISAPVKLITVGNLVKKKNHDFMVRVMNELKESKIDFEFEILGAGEEEKNLRKLILDLDLENKIHLRGSVGNVQEYLLNSHVYLHAAIPEPFGLAILEAMATGLPVVTLDGGGNRDFVIDNENGFLLSEKNVQHFSGKISSLINSEERYSSMSRNARMTAEKFGFDNFIERILQSYERGQSLAAL